MALHAEQVIRVLTRGRVAPLGPPVPVLANLLFPVALVPVIFASYRGFHRALNIHVWFLSNTHANTRRCRPRSVNLSGLSNSFLLLYRLVSNSFYSRLILVFDLQLPTNHQRCLGITKGA